MLVIGLTGGIGSGKSAVAGFFRESSINVVDADIASREVVTKGSEALELIAKHFGNDILLPDGTLDRRKMRELIFDNPEEKQWLESLLHPRIGQWIKDQLNTAKSPYAILESPLLLEAQQHQMTHRVLVVDVPESIQLQRASQRDEASEEQIRAIMAAQLSREKRLAGADDIIDNSGSLEDTKQQALRLHKTYLELAKNYA